MDFSYTDLVLPEDGVFKISPSQIDNFFSSPVVWYKEQVLKEKVQQRTTPRLPTLAYPVTTCFHLSMRRVYAFGRAEPIKAPSKQ